MASDGSDQDARYKLLQRETVAEYESEFFMLIKRVTGISESLLTSFYISGLKVALQIELLRARPTTLGEAFSLARITEARFEDERSATAIAKPNDLNTRYDMQEANLQLKTWDPGIKIFFRQHLEDKVVPKEWGVLRP
ncbi:hypothetical protein Tco_1306427 [Tanacetum coccineum]